MKKRILHIDGYDPVSEQIINPVILWKDAMNRSLGRASKVKHCRKVKLIEKGIIASKVKPLFKKAGWLNNLFIREFKPEKFQKWEKK